jgi:hypothetical protein
MYVGGAISIVLHLARPSTILSSLVRLDFKYHSSRLLSSQYPDVKTVHISMSSGELSSAQALRVVEGIARGYGWISREAPDATPQESLDAINTLQKGLGASVKTYAPRNICFGMSNVSVGLRKTCTKARLGSFSS